MRSYSRFISACLLIASVSGQVSQSKACPISETPCEQRAASGPDVCEGIPSSIRRSPFPLSGCSTLRCSFLNRAASFFCFVTRRVAAAFALISSVHMKSFRKNGERKALHSPCRRKLAELVDLESCLRGASASSGRDRNGDRGQKRAILIRYAQVKGCDGCGRRHGGCYLSSIRRGSQGNVRCVVRGPDGNRPRWDDCSYRQWGFLKSSSRPGDDTCDWHDLVSFELVDGESGLLV